MQKRRTGSEEAEVVDVDQGNEIAVADGTSRVQGSLSGTNKPLDSLVVGGGWRIRRVGRR